MMFEITSYKPPERTGPMLSQQPFEAEPVLGEHDATSSRKTSTAPSFETSDKNSFREIPECEMADQALLSRAALMTEAFEAIDVHDEGVIKWESITEYLERNLASGRLMFAEAVDKLYCIYQSSKFVHILNPITCGAGGVMDICYVDTYGKIALAGHDNSIHMMTTNGLTLSKKLSCKHYPPSCLEWMTGANKLLSGCIEGSMQVWDLETCSEITSKKAHNDFVTKILHSPGERVFVTASADSTMKIWDAQLLECKQVLTGHTRSVTSIALSKDYNCLISAGLDQNAMVWSPCNLKKPVCHLRGHPYSLCGVVVVPGTPQVVTADVSGTLRLWDLRNFRSFQTFGGSMQSLTSSCDQTSNRSRKEYRESRGQKAHVIFQATVGKEGVSCMTVCDDSKVLACGSGKAVHIFCLHRLQKANTVEGFSSLVQAIDCAPSGEFLVVGEESGVISVWRHGITEQQRTWTFFYCWEDISQLETLMCDGVTLEDLRNQIDGGQQTVETGQAMKFTYKRRLFSSANDDHELIVPASTRAVKVNKFQSDALQVYTADERGSIRLWDLSKVQERSALEAPNTPSKNREIIRLVGETEDKVSRCDTNAASATKMRRGVMAMYSRTFLTQPSSDWTDKGNVEPDGISMLRKRRDGTQGMYT
ncbi:wd g-beta repeat-containing protein [Cyclospora cayetanensis]|uniref:Wd g-beta repeat-containing protein n=1 Tax=Cyclospora cayetanensis TaxID=88456 RepID=A0A1D3D8X5_9EIME|nr:wd g-beta repeat-containing protein [Cyclospora cayetanensis]